MRKQLLYFLFGLFIILLSTPLAYKVVNIVYSNKNLTGEYVPILNGFIHSFMAIGILIFTMGLVNMIVNRNKNL